MMCGLDPGRHKIGVAFSQDGELLFSAIIPKKDESVLLIALKDKKWDLFSPWKKEGDLALLCSMELEKIFIGNGTSSKDLCKLLKEVCEIELRDEYGTTLKGRELYWKLHPPRGLWKFVPTSLRTPPRDIDDLAAWAIIK